MKCKGHFYFYHFEDGLIAKVLQSPANCLKLCLILYSLYYPKIISAFYVETYSNIFQAFTNIFIETLLTI